MRTTDFVKKLILIFSCIVAFNAFGEDPYTVIFGSVSEEKKPSKEIQESVAPYLMPHDHPIKPFLDRLFSSSRVIFNLKTLEEAGFDRAKQRKFSRLIVTRHSAFRGYIFKLYLDTQRYHKKEPEHHYWILRAKGARQITELINEKGLQAMFKVPRKWIYALPEIPRPSEDYYPKYYILVEEDMDILTDEENRNLWGSEYVSAMLLDNLHYILRALGLQECAMPGNVPFSRDGRVSFVDTQTWGYKEVYYEKLTPFLSESNQAYWKMITDQD